MNKIADILHKEFDNSPFELQDIIEFLNRNDEIRWEIFRQEEKHYHKEDIQNEINYINEENNTNYTFTSEEVDLILEDYEDSEEWSFRLRNVLDRWFEDKDEQL